MGQGAPPKSSSRPAWPRFTLTCGSSCPASWVPDKLGIDRNSRLHLNGSAPCPPRSISRRNPTLKSPRPPRSGRILDVAKDKLGIAPENLEPYGHYKAKVSMDYIKSLQDKKNGKLILVTAISPTPGGRRQDHDHGRPHRRAQPHRQEGDAVRCASPRSARRFGVKGGAAGGGYAQVIPMEDINLHFTGDFHAITSAHNLLSALIDNHIYWGNALGIDSRRVVWRRVLDMNDRALREIVCSLGGVANGYPREAGFDITVASEVMAIFCLAKDLDDLEEPPRQHHRRLYPRA